MPLTAKQEEFCRQYLVDLNGTQAAIRAGYAEKNARVTAAQNLAKPNVEARIGELKEERNRRTEVSADRVQLELARLAFSDMREFMEWSPRGIYWRDSTELSEDAAACVSEVSETISEGGRTRKLKLHDKRGALKDLAQHTGLLGKDGGAGTSVTVNVNNSPPAKPLSDFSDEELQFYKSLLATDDEHADAERGA